MSRKTGWHRVRIDLCDDGESVTSAKLEDVGNPRLIVYGLGDAIGYVVRRLGYGDPAVTQILVDAMTCHFELLDERSQDPETMKLWDALIAFNRDRQNLIAFNRDRQKP